MFERLDECCVFLLQKYSLQPIIVRGLIRQSDTIRIEGTAMNFSYDTLLNVKLRWICGFALVWVLTAMPPGASALNSPQRPTITPVTSTAVYKSGSNRNHDQQTYLAMIGPSPLRFAEGERSLPPEPVFPPPPKPKPPANVPEPGQKTPSETSGPVANPTTPGSENTELTATLTPSTLKPVSILPDDTQREIRAEDVLPFFQFPGAPDSGAVAVPFSTSQPRGTTAPRSSATYQQQ